MNRPFDADRARLQTLVDCAAADARERAADERRAGLPAGALAPAALEAFEPGPDDDEIIALVAEVYDLPPLDAIERLARLDFAAARAARE